MTLTINTKDTTRTPIVLVGRNTPNYGEQILENMLHILENFASSEEPSVKTVGMTWYNHGESTTDIKAGIDTINLPFQTRSRSLNYYDGNKWVELISKEDFARINEYLQNLMDTKDSALSTSLQSMMDAKDATVFSNVGAQFAKIAPATPKNGDIKTDSDGRIFLYSGDWQLVWPQLASDIYLDPNSINEFIGVNPTTASIEDFAGFGALYGVGYGDIGYGQTTYSFSLQSFSDYKTTLVTKTNLIALTNAIKDTAQFLGNTQIYNKAVSALTTLGNTSSSFFSTSLGIFDKQTLDTLFNNRLIDKNSMYENTLTQVILTNDSGVAFPTSTTLTAMTLQTLTASDYECTFNVDFSSADNARKFFNTGGELRLKLSYPYSTTAEDKIFKEFIDNKVGMLSLSSHDTKIVSGMMTANSNISESSAADDSDGIGYYELPVYDGAGGRGTKIASTTYQVGAELSHRVDVSVYACYSGATTNGAKGSIVRLTVVLHHYEATGASGYLSGYGVSGVVNQSFSNTAIIAKAGLVAKMTLIKASSPFVVSTPTISVIKTFK
jgi:hypothetical protein